jgi:hypothetical protein
MTKQQPTHEEIAELAYQYWKEREGGEGNSEDDWLRAEQDLVFLKESEVEGPE